MGNWLPGHWVLCVMPQVTCMCTPTHTHTCTHVTIHSVFLDNVPFLGPRGGGVPSTPCHFPVAAAAKLSQTAWLKQRKFIL